ncbi:Thioesterase/thiol ester dehydrase-isomerase [Glarea lozoyensis ATCC 20868]|uniref:Thioesterase/thiol ester dehydrase-isomerase n=1 Tax=Glarea lozoyensis (strain ATCC 20868 / MF5171) TaxID=1116229 RepID=S3CFX7_GLAL2|nr:Thioesterase/thiol ester dehydrase-isomerase [Glarea lozoyensis ATCC 20868]EPE25422.1 Thioesterase/thiol ester dehydrase-isomerase [Glarea lozoyensis ATCC 20868]
MSLQLPLRGSSALRCSRKATAISLVCSHPAKCIARQWQTRCQTRQYSTPPPPKTYFQPGDSGAPDPKYFKPVESQSTPSSTPPTTYFQPVNSQSPQDTNPPDAAPRAKRSLRPYIYSALFLAIGLTIGGVADRTLHPPPPLEPGSKADIMRSNAIYKLAERLPIVQSLSSDPEWTSQDAYADVPEEARKVRFTGGALGGSRGLGGFRRSFYHKTSGEAITVVHFGDGLWGFPKITHGGLIATVMDEVLGLCAIRQFPSKTGVTANLELNYLAPAMVGHFYIIRAIPVAKGMTERKCFVTGTVETVTGRILVEAKGLFVVPKGYELKAITT